MQHWKTTNGLPPAQGLYDPANEHDACGMGFVASIRGDKSHQIIEQGIQVLINLTHRGACGCDPETGDGAGCFRLACLLQSRLYKRHAS